jgi:hypothetical protein
MTNVPYRLSPFMAGRDGSIMTCPALTWGHAALWRSRALEVRGNGDAERGATNLLIVIEPKWTIMASFGIGWHQLQSE